MVRALLFAVALLALAAWLSPRGPDVLGTARVVDGDTIWIGDTKIRLFGIDAPESSDLLGPTATNWLQGATAGQSVACTRIDTDRYGRMVATCMVGQNDLSAEITRVGLARAYRRFSLDYVDEEQTARAQSLGIWSQPVPVAATQASTCLIKGNISNNGQIYHVPGSRHYDATRINTAKGDRWFCSPQEAEAAGWRPPRN